jgi:hypothetical protein
VIGEEQAFRFVSFTAILQKHILYLDLIVGKFIHGAVRTFGTYEKLALINILGHFHCNQEAFVKCLTTYLWCFFLESCVYEVSQTLVT